MTRKVLWLISLVAVASGAVVITRMVGAKAAPAAQPDLQELTDRLARLEAGMPKVERSLARAGAQLGVAALATARVAAGPDDEGTPEGEAREQRQAVDHDLNERQHYDQLDGMARSGGGAQARAQLSKNLDALAALPAGSTKLRTGVVDCSDALCRIEVALADPADVRLAARHLGHAMGGLSMRPFNGDRAVFYVAAPGHKLPSINP